MRSISLDILIAQRLLPCFSRLPILALPFRFGLDERSLPSKSPPEDGKEHILRYEAEGIVLIHFDRCFLPSSQEIRLRLNQFGRPTSALGSRRQIS